MIGQPPSSKVLMANGHWREIGRIEPGAEVVSPLPDGSCTIARVTGISRSESQPTYRLITTGRGGSRSYRCGAGQRLPFWAVERAPGERYKKQSMLREMPVTEFLERGHRYRDKARIFTAPAHELPEGGLQVHPYVLGVVLGNGSLSQARVEDGGAGHVSVTIRDVEVIKKCTEFGMTFRSQSWRNGAWVIYLTGEMSRYFRGSTLAGSTSPFKMVPREYLTGNIAQRLWLLAGLIDTDGTREEFSSSSEILAEDFVALIHSVGGVARCAARTTALNGRAFDSFRVNYSPTEHHIPVQCERKARRMRDMRWKNPRNTSFVAQDGGRSPLVSISLNSERRWYVTDDWLVTVGAGGD